MLEIGDYVMCDGRAHLVVGVTPIGVIPYRIQLQDPATDDVFWLEAELRQREEALYEVVKDAATRAHKPQE